MFYWGLIVGLYVGAFIGFVLASLLAMMAREGEANERFRRSETGFPQNN